MERIIIADKKDGIFLYAGEVSMSPNWAMFYAPR